MKSMKVDMKKYSLILILIGMMIVCSLLNSSFMSGTNLMNILKQVSIVTICSFAQGMIIITGDIDLSIGYLAGMAGTFACIVFVATQNLFLAFMVGVLIGAVVGAMQTVCFGIICRYTGGQNVYKIGNFKALGQSTVAGLIPITVVFMVIMFIITHVILKYTKFGRYLYAIGGNKEAAIAAGIQVVKVKWSAFIISGVFAAIAGMVMMGRLNAGIPGEGQGYETDAITATVIGGTSFAGGAGTAFGTFLGSVIIGVLNNIMNLMGVDSYIQMITKGLIIIGAVLVDSLSKQGKTSIKIMASSSDAKKTK